MTDEIIERIQRNLSGNPDLDRDYLISQMEFYKNHENAYLIIKEISKMIWQTLDSYEEEFNRSDRKTELARILDEVIPYIENRDRKTPLEILDRFMDHFIDRYETEEKSKVSEIKSYRPIKGLKSPDDINQIKDFRKFADKTSVDEKSSSSNLRRELIKAENDFESFRDLESINSKNGFSPYGRGRKRRKRNERTKDYDAGSSRNYLNEGLKTNSSNNPAQERDSERNETKKEYHSFLNSLEEILFYKYVGLKGEMAYIPFDEPLFDLYYLYGNLLLENDNFLKAETYLKKALKINPVSSKTLLDLADIYKSKTRTYNRFYLFNTDALKFAYSNEDIGRAYRNFGFFYVEEEQLEVAAAFYNYSLNFDYNVKAIREIEYLKSRGIDVEMSDEKMVEIIKSKHVQTGVNPFILDTLRIIAVDLDNRNYKNSALYYYRILYDLTKENQVLGRINAIQNKI